MIQKSKLIMKKTKVNPNQKDKGEAVLDSWLNSGKKLEELKFDFGPKLGDFKSNLNKTIDDNKILRLIFRVCIAGVIGTYLVFGLSLINLFFHSK